MSFQKVIETLKHSNFALFCLLYGSKVSFVDGTGTAYCALKNNKFEFVFYKKFWNKLTDKEKLFVVVHEIYHVFLGHFDRFKEIDSRTNIALDLSINDMVKNALFFEDSDIPYLRKVGCWPDTVIPGKTLMPGLSAEEYLYALPEEPEGSTFDMHENSSGSLSSDDLGGNSQSNTDSLVEKVRKAVEKATGEKCSKEKAKSILESDDILGALAGTGSGEEETSIIVKKSQQTWLSFAKKLKKTIIGDLEEYNWVPDKRLLGLMPENIFLPSENELDLEVQIELVLFLDTSYSCKHLIPHFLGFAKAVPDKNFKVTTFGFNTRSYKLDKDLKNYKVGGTCFSDFQSKFDSVPAKNKYAFVFTDGEGTKCNLDQPEKWFWVLSKMNTSCIPKKCNILKLSDFKA